MATILMVDDNNILLELYREVLSPDFHVLTACTVAESITLLTGEQVDAVGCDYHLGDGLGLDVVAWIAAHQPDLLATTMLISGDASPPMRGFDIKLLYKPVPIDTLLKVFDAWFTPTDGGRGDVIHAA